MRIWNPNAIKDTTLFDSGPYLFTIESIEEGQTRAGQFAYKAVLRATEGKADFIGMPKFETFTMGTEQDPQWQDPDTVGPGARGFKNLLRACGLDVDHPDVDELIAAATGQTVGGIVDKALDKGGTMRDNVTRWYPAATPPAAPAKAAPPVAAKPTAQTVVQKAVAQAKPAAPKAETSIKCGVCNTMVPRSQFGQHVATHEE